MERYGVKPERFTKAWFEYVWDYYKIHIIVGLVLLAAVIYTVIAITSRTEYDLFVCFSTNSQMSDQSKEKVIEELKKTVKDIDGDGEINICVYDFPFASDYDDIEYKKALEEKFHLELQAGESFLYVISKDVLDTIKYRSEIEGLFSSPSEWSKDVESEGEFASIQDSTILDDANITEKDLYVGVRNYRYSEKEEKDGQKRENAISAAKAILE